MFVGCVFFSFCFGGFWNSDAIFYAFLGIIIIIRGVRIIVIVLHVVGLCVCMIALNSFSYSWNTSDRLHDSISKNYTLVGCFAGRKTTIRCVCSASVIIWAYHDVGLTWSALFFVFLWWLCLDLSEVFYCLSVASFFFFFCFVCLSSLACSVWMSTVTEKKMLVSFFHLSCFFCCVIVGFLNACWTA